MTLLPKPNRYRNWLVLAVLYLCAAAIGVGSAWVTLRKLPGNQHSVKVGAWVGSTLTGSTQADMYTRARVALEGLLALSRDETMYYVAYTDDAGRPLRVTCSYRVTGIPPAARWWSVTAYAEDLFLFAAANGHYSLNSTIAQLDTEGRFALRTGPTAPSSEYWLPTPGDGQLVLTLRLYHPASFLQADPGKLTAPSIVPTGGCA